jgi:hypothetical protein
MGQLARLAVSAAQGARDDGNKAGNRIWIPRASGRIEHSNRQCPKTLISDRDFKRRPDLIQSGPPVATVRIFSERRFNKVQHIHIGTHSQRSTREIPEGFDSSRDRIECEVIARGDVQPRGAWPLVAPNR